MSNITNKKQPSFVKIAYSKPKKYGKTELVPMELYSDGSVKRSLSYMD